MRVRGVATAPWAAGSVQTPSACRNAGCGGRPRSEAAEDAPHIRRVHFDTTTRLGSAKRNAAFTLQHGAMLTTRQPEGCVPVVVSRCAHIPAGQENACIPDGTS